MEESRKGVHAEGCHNYAGKAFLESTKKRLGKRIRSLRASQNLTQETLAEKAGLSQKYLGEVERGDGNVTVELLTKIAGVLSIPLAAIMDNEHEQPLEALQADTIRMIPKLSLKEAQIAHRMVKLLAGE